MPASITHYYFARDCLERDSGKLAFLKDNEDLVYVGTQGPDPFFFYGVLPWRSKKDRTRVAAFGSWLHDINPVKSFPLFCELIQNGAVLSESERRGRDGRTIRAVPVAGRTFPDSPAAESVGGEVLGGRIAQGPAASRRNELFAYLYGILLHYALDRRVHPYVYFRTGFDKNGELSGRYFPDHIRFETAMDLCLVLKHGESIRTVKTYEVIRARPEAVARVSGLYAVAFPERIAPDSFFLAWSDMAVAQKFLYDPPGAKRRLLGLLGPTFAIPQAMIHLKAFPAEDKVDYLNEARETWRHPVSGRESSQSVSDLYELAFTEMGAAAELLAAAWEGRSIEADWPVFLAGVNHDGTLEGETKRIFESVYR